MWTKKSILNISIAFGSKNNTILSQSEIFLNVKLSNVEYT